jgi:amino acid adenylation domain-containing protein
MEHELIGPTEARRRLLERMLSGQAPMPDAAKAPEAIRRRDPAARVPLTTEQRQVWLHAQLAPDMALYNESITIHRRGCYDHGALERALSEIVRRHEIWRTAFVEVDDWLTQQVAPPFAVTLPVIDISHMPEPERDAEAVRLATEDARAQIPLGEAPLFRARVVRLGPEEHRLYLTLHHLIFDGVSIYRTLVPELAALVAAFEAGKPSPLAEPALQYADYAVWQEARDPASIGRQIERWRETLAEPLPRLEIVGDRPRAAVPTHAGSMEVFDVAAPLIGALKAVARAESATLYMVLLAAYKAMLFRYTGENDIIVGGVTDTRRRRELQPLIGYFLNSIPLRSSPEGKLPFRAYLASVKASVIGALEASDVPFDQLVRALDIKRGSGTHPLFSTLFSIEPPVDPFPEGWDLTQMDVVVGAAKYDLYLELDERPEGGMAGRFLYSTELFDAATIRRMIGHWTRLLAGVAADPATPIARLPLLGPEEQRTLVTDWNNTVRPLPHESVVEWFAARTAEMPGAIAIRCLGEEWSYAELARRSDAIAARLAAEGVSPGALVGLALDRSPMMVAAMLGVLKAGAAYLPLDPGFPPARLEMIARDAAPVLVLVEAATAPVLPAGVAPLLHLDGEWPATAFASPPVDGEALAYVLYTSGSTGEPKGVEIPHAALVNLLGAIQETPGFTKGETLLAVTTLSFDIAGLELWLPLVSGGTILLAPRATSADMAALADLIATAPPDVMQATPATWRGLIDAGWQGDRRLRVLCGGEAMPRALADQLSTRVGSLWNMYGPTETTIWSTVARIQPGGAISIGRPIANTHVRILDGDGNDRPIGAVGELLIGGRGVARGYRGRPDLTAQRFVWHDGERMYRTGDLARWRPDGMLECLGRTDHEQKIRGFRVAIEEVEGALARLPGVRAAAVRGWPDASGERALAGYVVGSGEPGEWREALAAILPDYMIPARFVSLDSLPVTPNGKIDRAQLPEPRVGSNRESAAPLGRNEERLAAIWRDVLKVDQVARTDDFFDLGGHSLLVARLLRRIESEYGVRVPMAAVFRAPRLAGMAELVAAGFDAGSPVLAPIQPLGSAAPILWLDGGSTFRHLAERLGTDQPFIGVSVDAVLEAAGGCPPRFEDAARLVVTAISKAQPRGPYRLGGWCTSGILAYAVAAQLREQGEDVALLMLVHAFDPVRARTIGAARFFLSKLRFHIGQSLMQPRGERWTYFRERLRGLSDAALAGGREAVLQPALRSALDKVALAYTPPIYDGPVILFQPAEHPDLLDFIDDWRARVVGPFSARIIPGGHRTMLEPPYVDILAAAIRPKLAVSAARYPRRAGG